MLLKKIVFKCLVLLPLMYWTTELLLGIFLQYDLGVAPDKKFLVQFGYYGFTLLLLNLGYGALRDLIKIPKPVDLFLFKERRFVGIVSFLVLVIHFGFYLLTEAFEAKAWTQIIEKRYLQAAALALFGLFLLTITSNNYSQRLLKARWKKLHRLVVPIMFLVSVHLLSIEKSNLILLASLLGAYWIMYALRIAKKYKRSR